MSYFEQFVGDDPLDYATIEKRLAYLPTGEYIPYDDAGSFHNQEQKLWQKVGSPQMWMGSFIASTAIEAWANGQLLYRNEQ